MIVVSYRPSIGSYLIPFHYHFLERYCCREMRRMYEDILEGEFLGNYPWHLVIYFVFLFLSPISHKLTSKVTFWVRLLNQVSSQSFLCQRLRIFTFYELYKSDLEPNNTILMTKVRGVMMRNLNATTLHSNGPIRHKWDLLPFGICVRLDLDFLHKKRLTFRWR